ncbi:hypothetical protein CRE_07248 [Caenorhabditis remanei]|uniref:Uncharacterized protein n=1 Tax=Caenorhabditis remanei TaxID=31234 RepID=E3M2B8_CAERE|nr:hypothetical protein CRE_07248 [Caenorhabditis remanei]
MRSFLTRLFNRQQGLDPVVVQKKEYQEEKKKAEKELMALRELLTRQPSYKKYNLRADILDAQDTFNLYTGRMTLERIGIQDRIEGLRRLNTEMSHLKEKMKKSKISMSSWVIQSWHEHRIERDHRMEMARQRKEHDRRMDSFSPRIQSAR